MEQQFWAKCGSKQVGPYPTRAEALAAFRAAFPHKGPDYMRAARKNQILTGFGTFGPGGDMRWDNA